MGLFSWDCIGCGESIKAPYELPEDMAWQNKCVAISPNNMMEAGPYDGYGRISGQLGVDVEVWHHKCWEEAGQPMKYTEASPPSGDQGFFYDYPDEHS